MKAPYYKYADYLKEKFGERVQKISVDGNFTCPNRDGTKGIGGCTYCNNESFAPALSISEFPIKKQIEIGKERIKRRYDSSKFLIYFQAYSNTYAPLDKLKALYEEALSVSDVVGLSIGTRSDCIDLEKIEYLQKLAKDFEITIEYGLESTSDLTLKKINRGHDLLNFTDAIALTKNRGIKICTHLILGFPWESENEWIESADFISKLEIDFLKLHQLHVVKGTKLGSDYLKSPFKTLTKDEYFEILIKFLERLSPKIAIQRLFGEAPKEMLLSPHWEEPLSKLTTEFNDLLTKRGVSQGNLYLNHY